MGLKEFAAWGLLLYFVVVVAAGVCMYVCMEIVQIQKLGFWTSSTVLISASTYKKVVHLILLVCAYMYVCALYMCLIYLEVRRGNWSYL